MGYTEEYYICWECNKMIEINEINTKWKCPHCDDFLMIHTKKKGRNLIIKRKEGDEIEINDLVDLQLSEEPFHEVLNLKLEKGSYKVALKNQGIWNLRNGEYLNIINGSWDGDVEKLKRKYKYQTM